MQNDEIMGTLDPEYVEKLVERKQEIDNGSWASSGVVAALALGSVPVALAALSRDVYGQTAIPAAVKTVFDFALALEIFENEFYKAVLGTGVQGAAFLPVRTAVLALPGGSVVVDTLKQIQKHEQAHVDTLTTLGATNVFGLDGTTASFDFTAGGVFTAATTDPQVLLAVAQGAEDTGVRAYKGQAPNLMGAGFQAYLEGALRIHSVEARHASRIRRIRRSLNTGTTAIRWSGTVRGGGAAAAGAAGFTPSTAQVGVFNAIYAGEDNVTQAGINVNTELGSVVSGFGVEAAQEAFDEPLDRAAVIAIVQPFFKKTLM